MSLMNYINADNENPIFAMAFSSKEKLLEYLEDNKMEMLLVSEEALSDEEIKKNTDGLNVLKLAEEKTLLKDYSYIYKYSKAEIIQDRIVRAYKSMEEDIKSELFETFAVISPVGRSGKTGLAKALCSLDEVRGGLYIGMETFGEYKEENISCHNMSDISFLIKTRSEEIIKYLEESVVQRNEFSEILSPESYLDVRDLDYKDMKWFINRLISWNRFTTIVFDMDGAILGDITILGLFDNVIVPVTGDVFSDKKLDAFRHMLNIYELGKVTGRMKEIIVPDAVYNSTEMMQCAGRLFKN